MNPRELQADPSKFRDFLKIDADGKTVRLGAVLDDWQRDDFEALDPAWKKIVGQSKESGTNRAWLERPRGHSKTTDIAASVSYALFASRRQIRGVCAAADAEQAGLIKKAIDSMCRLNPWLDSILEVQNSRVVNKNTGSELEIITSDSASSYGKLVDFVVCDELTHWRTNALWVSLASTAAKRGQCILLVITNAGFETEWQFELREAIKVIPKWYFSRLEGPKPAGSLEDRLDEQRRLLPTIDFNRLWLNIWGKASGNALEEADIEAAVTLSGPITEPEKGWKYVAGLDIGLRRNASALVVLGKHVGYRIEREKRQRLTARKRMLIDAGVIDEPEPDYIGKHEPGYREVESGSLVDLERRQRPDDRHGSDREADRSHQQPLPTCWTSVSTHGRRPTLLSDFGNAASAPPKFRSRAESDLDVLGCVGALPRAKHRAIPARRHGS